MGIGLILPEMILLALLDPSQQFSGTYKYIGGNGGCSDTSLLSVTIITNGSAGNDAQVNVCASTDLFAFLQGNPTAGGTWLDPSGNVFTNPLDPANDPAGMYTYIVNSSGCSDTSYTSLS
jgi:hypothetical protein